MATFCKGDNVFTQPWEWTQHVRNTDREDFARNVLWDSTCSAISVHRLTIGAQNSTMQKRLARNATIRLLKVRDAYEHQ